MIWCVPTAPAHDVPGAVILTAANRASFVDKTIQQTNRD
jgi:hypothetical protein